MKISPVSNYTHKGFPNQRRNRSNINSENSTVNFGNYNYFYTPNNIQGINNKLLANPFKLVNKAITFATKAHNGQFRKGTNIPYIYHPLEALSIVARITPDPELHAAAVLHDTIEDTNTTYDDINKKFGRRIADIINSESEDKSKTWEERKSDTLEKLKNESTDVKIVALGDKLSNMRSIARDYLEIGDKLWERFNVKDKNKQGWYYKGIVVALDELTQTTPYQELLRLTTSIFNN